MRPLLKAHRQIFVTPDVRKLDAVFRLLFNLGILRYWTVYHSPTLMTPFYFAFPTIFVSSKVSLLELITKNNFPLDRKKLEKQRYKSKFQIKSIRMRSSAPQFFLDFELLVFDIGFTAFFVFFFFFNRLIQRRSVISFSPKQRSQTTMHFSTNTKNRSGFTPTFGSTEPGNNWGRRPPPSKWSFQSRLLALRSRWYDSSFLPLRWASYKSEQRLTNAACRRLPTSSHGSKKKKSTKTRRASANASRSLSMVCWVKKASCLKPAAETQLGTPL